MTRDEVLALEGVDLDGAIAQCVFRHRIKTNADGKYCRKIWSWDTSRWQTGPDYSSSLDAARLVEDEVGRRGFQTEYIVQLSEVFGCSGMRQIDWECALLRASAADRCRAALLALEVERGN